MNLFLMSAAEKLDVYTLEQFIVVEKDGQKSPMTAKDAQGITEEEGTTIIGTLEEALPTCLELEAARLRKDVKALLSNLGAHPSEELSDLLRMPYKPSKSSPLPAIPTEFDKFDPANDNRNLLKGDSKVEGIHWLAPIDCDKTLYKAKSEFSIMLHDFAKFLKKEQHAEEFVEAGGNLELLEELITFCDKWETYRRLSGKVSEARMIKLLGLDELSEEEKQKEYSKLKEYSEGIKESGNLSAFAFAGMEMKKLEEFGRKFMNSDSAGEFFEYTPAVIEKLRDHGILPVIVTGAPDFLVPAILEKSGITHGQGMTYEMDEEGKMLLPADKAGVEKNMGTSEVKAQYCKGLSNKHYAIALAMGDSEGDMGLFSKAANPAGRTRESIFGGVVMINASDSATAELKRHHNTNVGHRVRIIGTENMSTADVIKDVGIALERVFEPLDEYREVKDDPVKLAAYLKDLQQRKDDEKKHANLENIKAIRDVLKEYNLNQAEITAVLLEHYPKIVVVDVMKSYMVDTRDPSAVDAFNITKKGRAGIFRALGKPELKETVNAYLRTRAGRAAIKRLQTSDRRSIQQRKRKPKGPRKRQAKRRSKKRRVS